MMPFIYVRGFLSHAGKVFEGLNPVSVLSEIVTRTEVDMDFADVVKVKRRRRRPLYMKDSKDRYDVSMPLSARGCFSVLTLETDAGRTASACGSVCRTSLMRS